MFLKVSTVREDGGASELTLIGYGAEALAFQQLEAFRKSKYVRYGQVVERHDDNGVITWERRASFFKE